VWIEGSGVMGYVNAWSYRCSCYGNQRKAPAHAPDYSDSNQPQPTHAY
jgi:hypothetical protein